MIFFTNFKSTINLTDFLNSINSMGVGFSIADARLDDEPLVYVNQGFLEMTGYTLEDVLLKNCRFLQGADTNMKQVAKIREAIQDRRTVSVTLKNYRKDDSYFWNQFIISPVFNADGQAIYYIGLQFDVTQEVEEKQTSRYTIENLSKYDQLTGLMNVGLFKEMLQQEVSGENIKSGAVLRVNLNRFRNINNSYGEALGDKILLEVAARLKGVFSQMAPICRSFADDFIILLKSVENSIQLANIVSLLEKVLKKPYLLNGEELTIDFNIGISQFPEDGREAELLVKFASLAMKEVRNDKLTNHLYFAHSLLEKLEKRMTIEAKFLKALEKKEFLLNYQPKVDTKTTEIIGMEALIRWQDELQGIISPLEFIPIAEDTGFIISLGEWVLLEACGKNKEWQDKGLLQIPVSVNVSTVQFTHPHFTEMVKKVLNKTGLDPKYLELEVTESLFHDIEIMIHKLNELKAIGVKVSIDDFGTGYSSINYLKVLPVDVKDR